MDSVTSVMYSNYNLDPYQATQRSDLSMLKKIVTHMQTVEQLLCLKYCQTCWWLNTDTVQNPSFHWGY